jgi:hypothetical protein
MKLRVQSYSGILGEFTNFKVKYLEISNKSCILALLIKLKT